MILLFLFYIKAKSFFILINTSRGFHNYRHMTDMFLMNHIILQNKIPPSNIITYFPEDIYTYKCNIMPDYVQIDGTDKKNYLKLRSKGFTVNDVLNGLRGNIQELKNIKKSDNVFVYIIGHGCDGSLKFYDKEWLTKYDLMKSLRILSKRINKIFLILDTCEAESIISRDIENMYVVTTSAKGEPSLSLEKNNLLGINTVDEFSFYFQETLKSLNHQDLTLNDLFKELNTYDFSSTITWTDDETYKFKDFF